MLVAAIIPGCRLFEKRWERLSESGEAARTELRPLFCARRSLMLWVCAIGLPFLVTGSVKVILSLL